MTRMTLTTLPKSEVQRDPKMCSKPAATTKPVFVEYDYGSIARGDGFGSLCFFEVAVVLTPPERPQTAANCIKQGRIRDEHASSCARWSQASCSSKRTVEPAKAGGTGEFSMALAPDCRCVALKTKERGGCSAN